MRKSLITVVLLIAIVITFCGCNTAQSGEKIVFGTFYNIKIKGASSHKDIKSIDTLLYEIENTVSTSVVDSDVYLINNSPVGTPIPINKHTKRLFLESKRMYEATDSAFNACIFPLVELWKFAPHNFQLVVDSIPNQNEINNLLPYCDFAYFEYDNNLQTITRLSEHTKLDFGGIAKGYAVDQARQLAENNKDVLINIGGNIATFGEKKQIGLRHPRLVDNLFGIISLHNQSIATSGDYERYYTFDNVRYHHIIGTDGYPVGINGDDNIVSVSIVGESALLCDVYSTAVMILGSVWAQENLPQGYASIIITKKHYQIIGDLHFESRQSTHQKI